MKCAILPWSLLVVAAAARAQEQVAWKPVEGHLMTPWAKDVSPERVWPEYPRPTMVRERWMNLNGLWDYAISNRSDEPPQNWTGKILVPFPIESALSGVGKRLEPHQVLWYRRTFRVPDEWKGQRVLLHFGAVDWRANVTVNGRSFDMHQGGYDAFEFDVTDALIADNNVLVVRVEDPTDAGGQPRGKQVLKPEGIWYTPSSGIWQTVWLEPVPEARISGLSITSTLEPDGASVHVRADCTNCGEWTLGVEVLADERRVAAAASDGGSVGVRIEDARAWSPDDPYLYDLRISAMSEQDGRTLDTVRSYCGLRDIRIGDDDHGVQRLLLNGQPLFQFGPLDQGFWPDGLYTPPTDEAMRFDIEAVKKMGGNMLRKHVKVECERFYYWCDKLGVLVWQDMPSANNESPDRMLAFVHEMWRLITARGRHPSIVMWVPFNEGWGQFETKRIVRDLISGQDRPRRLIDNASGWTDEHCGDVIDIHAYPGPAMAPPEANRASVLGEFGGLGLPIEGHTWVEKGNWGYVRFANQQELTDAYVALLDKLRPLIAKGLSAAVYTQTTDVEIECNGWLTYDRAVWKIDPERAAAAARRLYEPPPQLRVVVARAGEGEPATWRFTTGAPPREWFRVDFDERSWKQGKAGFGAHGTPGAVIGTEWTTGDIWIRRTFDLASAGLAEPWLAIHHDEDAEVYVNGELALETKGYTVDYAYEPLRKEAREALRAGANTLAVHCRQTAGGQYVDVGLVDLLR